MGFLPRAAAVEQMNSDMQLGVHLIAKPAQISYSILELSLYP
jgi:hypothetical protein